MVEFFLLFQGHLEEVELPLFTWPVDQWDIGLRRPAAFFPEIVPNGGYPYMVVVLGKLAVDPAPGEPFFRRDPVCPLAPYLVDACHYLFHYRARPENTLFADGLR
jgi:hypothetical protein